MKRLVLPLALTIILLFIITLAFMKKSKNNLNIDSFSIGDDISSYISEKTEKSMIMCSSSQISPYITVNDGKNNYMLAYSSNKIIAIFYPSIFLNDTCFEVNKSSVNDIKTKLPNLNIVKENGFGYILKFDNINFIVIKDTHSDLLDDDLITYICKK